MPPVMDPAQVPAIKAGLAEIDAAFAADDVGRYLNFTEIPAEIETMFPAGALERLREVKARYDPGNAIRANHPITALVA